MQTPQPARFRQPKAAGRRPTAGAAGPASAADDVLSLSPSPKRGGTIASTTASQAVTSTLSARPASARFAPFWRQEPRRHGHGDDTIEDSSSPPRETEMLDAAAKDIPTRSASRWPAERQTTRKADWPEQVEDILVAESSSSGSSAGGSGTDGQILVGDSFARESSGSEEDAGDIATPVPRPPQEQRPRLPQRSATSASRLLLAVQPPKRRRLFEPAALITSSPPSEPADGEDTEKEEEEEEGREPRATEGLTRWRRPRRISVEDIVDDDDKESSEDDEDERHESYDEIRDSFNVALDESENDDDRDRMDDTDGRRLQRQRRRSTALQHARLFAQPRRPAADNDADTDAQDDEASRPRWADHDPMEHDDTLLVRLPPPDFFSPQKRRKRRTGKRKRGPPDAAGALAAADPTAAEGTATAAPDTSDEKYVPGGMAAELRGWLVQIKSNMGLQTGGGGGGGGGAIGLLGGGRVAIDEARSDQSLRLVRGTLLQPAQHDPIACHVLLAGDGGRRQAHRIELAKGSVVSVAPPLWEISLDGQSWTVACDWWLEE